MIYRILLTPEGTDLVIPDGHREIALRLTGDTTLTFKDGKYPVVWAYLDNEHADPKLIWRYRYMVVPAERSRVIMLPNNLRVVVPDGIDTETELFPYKFDTFSLYVYEPITEKPDNFRVVEREDIPAVAEPA